VHSTHHGPAAVQHGLGPGAQVALVYGGADDDAVGPFQAVVELGYVVLVDAAAALTDAVVAVDAEVEVFTMRWVVAGLCTVFLFKVFEAVIYNVIC